MIEPDRLIAPTATSPNEEVVERALRPKTLAEYVGQAKIREQLDIFIRAARNRGEAAGSFAAVWPAGFGQDHAGAYCCGRNGRESSSNLWTSP